MDRSRRTRAPGGRGRARVQQPIPARPSRRLGNAAEDRRRPARDHGLRRPDGAQRGRPGFSGRGASGRRRASRSHPIGLSPPASTARRSSSSHRFGFASDLESCACGSPTSTRALRRPPWLPRGSGTDSPSWSGSLAAAAEDRVNAKETPNGPDGDHREGATEPQGRRGPPAQSRRRARQEERRLVRERRAEPQGARARRGGLQARDRDQRRRDRARGRAQVAPEPDACGRAPPRPASRRPSAAGRPRAKKGGAVPGSGRQEGGREPARQAGAGARATSSNASARVVSRRLQPPSASRTRDPRAGTHGPARATTG